MKRFFILGMGRSGLSSALFLKKQGFKGSVWDDDSLKRAFAEEQGLEVFCPSSWSDIDPFILSPGIPHTYPCPHPLVAAAKAQGCHPVSDISVFFRLFPTTKAIGVTGSYGKSTTCALLHHGLQRAGIASVLAGNFGIPIFQNPQPEKIYVLELSSYQLDISPSLPLMAAALLPVVPHHIERHGSLEHYIQAKLSIFNNATYLYHSKGKGLDLLSYGLPAVCPIETKQYPSVASHLLPHDQENAAMAAALLSLFDLRGSDMFQDFKGLPHRQEKIGFFQNITYINDSKATSPEAAAQALRNVASSVLWIAGGVVQEDDLLPLQEALPKVQKAFLIGQSAGRYADFLKRHNTAYVNCDTLENALFHATQEGLEARVPCTILLSPGSASFDQFSDFEQRGQHFCSWIKTYWERKETLL